MRRAEALEEPTEKIRELLEVTQIWKKEVSDYDKATPAFERVLSIEPTHDEAFVSLERLHTAAARWEPLIELYLDRLETREATEEKNDLLRRIARIFEEKLDDKNQAFDALVKAFDEDYGDDETVRYLEKMAAGTGRWGELIQTANAWLQEEEDARRKIDLCLRLGKWYGEDLGHPEYAQPYYAQVMQLDPNNVQVLRQMSAIYRLGAQWQKMGETLTRALDVAVANDDKKVILCDLGDLLEKHMNQADQGITFYRRALDVDPLYLPGLEALERIYDERGNHADLVEILTSKVRALTDTDQIAQHKMRLGGLYETALGDFERGGKVYREVLELDGSNIFALRGLERIYQALQAWPDMVDILERQLDVVETERERIDVLLKLAQIQEEQFLKADIAAQRLEQVVEIDPSCEPAYISLERCYRRLKQWLDLINTFERHISEAADQATKIELYAQMAEVYAQEVGDVDRAIDAYQNIVDLDENNIEALDALSKLYEKQGDAARAIESMTRVADLTTDGTQRVEMYYRIGKALDEKLSDRSQAQERFEMALDLDPTHLPTLAALRIIAVDEQDWDRAARYLEQEQLTTQAPRARAKLLVELGKLRDEMLNEHEQAVLAYELAMQCDQDCEEAALPLLQEYIGVQRWSDAEPLAEMLVKKSKNHERHEQHMLHKLLGTVHAALGNHERALKAYQTANHLDLTDQETIRGIADAGYELKDWPTALTNYQKVLTALGEDDVEAAHRRLLPARLHQARAGPGQAGHQQLREGAGAERRAPAHARSAGRHLRAGQRLEAGRRLQAADARQRLRRRGALLAAQRNRRYVGREGEEPPEGHRGSGRGARPQADGPRAAAQAAAALRRGHRVAEDDRYAALDLSHRGEARDQEPLLLHDGSDLPRQAQRLGSLGGAVQRGARPESRVLAGLRAHQQDPDAGKELEAARAVLPQDAAPHRRQGKWGPRVHAVAPARADLPRPAAARGRSHRGVQDGVDHQARRRHPTADPCRALRGQRALRRGHRFTA